MCEPGGFQVILGFLKVYFGDGFDFVAGFCTTAFAFRRDQRDFGEIDVLAVIQCFLLGLNTLSVEFNAESSRVACSC